MINEFLTKANTNSPFHFPKKTYADRTDSSTHTAADNRKNYRSGREMAPQPDLLTQNRELEPQIKTSNGLAATVSDFSPKPGRHLRRTMHVVVRNTPADRVDQVVDAMQRYMDIRPRREPTADPLDEASIARFPQQILESGQRWDQARLYQFSTNGVLQTQYSPKYRAWGGDLELNLNGIGVTNVTSTESKAPEPILVGAPNMVDDPYFDPAFAAQNAMRRLRELLDTPEVSRPQAGPGNMVDNPYFHPSQAAGNAMGHLRELLSNSPGVGKFYQQNAGALSSFDQLQPSGPILTGKV